jgi:glycine/D-amino acid oxidase-like deaminating enzyme
MHPEGGEAIVGGGVMGLSLARALAQRRRGVTVYSAGERGMEGASAAPVALLNPFRGRTGRASADDRAALAFHWRTVAALRAEGFDPGAHPTGVLRIADSDRQMRGFRAVEGLLPLAAEHLPAPYRSPFGGALAPTAGWVEPARYLAALAGSLAAAGGSWLLRRIEAIEPVDGHWLLTTDHGEAFRHAHVWLCIGASAWPTGWGRHLAPPPALERHAGDIVLTPLPPPSVPLAGGTYVGPSAGQAAIGGHHRPPGPTPADAVARLVRNLHWAYPELGTVAIDAEPWWGVRAHLPGNRPQGAPLAAGVTWVGGLAGRGFLASAALAEALAQGTPAA